MWMDFVQLRLALTTRVGLCMATKFGASGRLLALDLCTVVVFCCAFAKTNPPQSTNQQTNNQPSPPTITILSLQLESNQ